MTNQAIQENNEFPQTPLAEIDKLFAAQRLAFAGNKYPDIPSRIALLKQLKSVLLAEQQALITTLSADFGPRCHDETRISELLTLVEAINSSTKQVNSWS